MNFQSLAADQFFHFFLRLRKGEIRRTVQVLQSRYPDENPAELAQRLIESKATLSLVGGTLLHLPLLVSAVGQALKLLNVVGATSLLTRMHLYLILEIALVFGKDIDGQVRVPEMAAVVAATGASAVERRSDNRAGSAKAYSERDAAKISFGDRRRGNRRAVGTSGIRGTVAAW